MIRRVVAERSPALVARVTRCIPMTYAAGADSSADRPAHVRAASGLAWFGDRLAVVQDDASFIALVDPATGLADAVPLPPGIGGIRQFDDSRGNKADKLDLEAVVSVRKGDAPMLLALGSGSTDRRERVALLDPDGTVAVLQLSRFYAALRAAHDFAGSELNIEGAVDLTNRLRLFARGNGAVRGELLPVNATCDIEWPALREQLKHPDDAPAPMPLHIVQYDLGDIAGVKLGFTDAALLNPDAPGTRRILYSAAAESSPDAVRDGEVMGSAIGVIEDDVDDTRARWSELLGQDGERLTVKVEGIAVKRGGVDEAYIVVDRDDHELPSELCEVLILR